MAARSVRATSQPRVAAGPAQLSSAPRSVQATTTESVEAPLAGSPCGVMPALDALLRPTGTAAATVTPSRDSAAMDAC
jgi:hypothetical protein